MRGIAALLLVFGSLAAPAQARGIGGSDAAQRLPAAPGRSAAPALAITFDDLPAHAPWPAGTDRVGIARRIVRVLRAARVGEVYGFVNYGVAERDPAVAPFLGIWTTARLPLGNHGWSHADLDAVGAAAFVADSVRNEPALATTGRDWRWFRYPYLHEGSDPAQRVAVRDELARRGYRIAAVTMSFEDYLWNPPYARCAGDRRAIAALERSYLAAARDALRASRSQARAVYGRDIPYVLLVHVGAFTARMLPRLLAQYRHDGVRFVTLGEAEADPAYAADRDPALPPVASLAQRAGALPGVYRAPDYATALAAACAAVERR